MIRLRGIALLLLPALLILSAARARAQIYFPPPVFYPPFGYPGPRQPPPDPPDPNDAPIEMGGYLNVGSASESPGPVAALGVYGQWNRYGWCPGLDLRLQGGSYNVRGVLVGPRLAYQPRGIKRIFRPYVEVLLGPNELRDFQGHPEPRGVTLAGVVGVDIHYNSAFGWRLIEYTKGDFTGLSGIHPQTISTGLVIHLP